MSNLPNERLRIIARAAIVAARGDSDDAFARFDKNVIAENDAALERALCVNFRSIAIRALLATHFNELRAEGKIRQPDQTRIRTTNYGGTTEAPRRQTWAKQHVEKVEERARSYLNDFRVNGESIGDCTAEVVLHQAENHERDARFMRLMASGVPPTGKIRDYVTEDEAKDRWNRAQEEPKTFRHEERDRYNSVLTLLCRGLRNEKEHAAALARASELMDAEHGTMDGCELDALARVISEYEDKHN